MELNAAFVRLPRDLDAASTARLASDLQAALASPAPVVCVGGSNDDEFCIGLAIGASHEEAVATRAFARVLAAMHDAPKPLLAIVDGRAIGGGMGLACACDWVVASDRASFGLPELLWGLVPAIIWPVIADRMAPHVARQWTLAAHTRTADEGAIAGLVDEVVPASRLADAAARRARSLGRLEPQALRRFRAWRRTAQQQDLHTALDLGADLTASMLSAPLVRARWQAFTDGATPWSI